MRVLYWWNEWLRFDNHYAELMLYNIYWMRSVLQLQFGNDGCCSRRDSFDWWLRLNLWSKVTGDIWKRREHSKGKRTCVMCCSCREGQMPILHDYDHCILPFVCSTFLPICQWSACTWASNIALLVPDIVRFIIISIISRVIPANWHWHFKQHGHTHEHTYTRLKLSHHCNKNIPIWMELDLSITSSFPFAMPSPFSNIPSHFAPQIQT